MSITEPLTVKITDLTYDQRRLVLALIAAKRSGDEHMKRHEAHVTATADCHLCQRRTEHERGGRGHTAATCYLCPKG